MKCPICEKRLPVYGDRCTECGYRIPDPEDHEGSSQPDPAIPVPGIPYYEPPNKTSRTKCCCCAAILIVPLLVLFIGAVIFGVTMVMNETVMEEFGIFEELPFQNVPESLPAEQAEDVFSIRNGEVTFLSHKWNGGTVINVPETVNGQTVTALAPGCFADCRELTTIVLPATLTQIGADAFSGCTDLRGLLIPEGTMTIGGDAFAGCTSLEALYVPDSMNFIAPGALADCDSLLYIFYNGTFDVWNALYSGFITPFTTAICIDGAYYHGATG